MTENKVADKAISHSEIQDALAEFGLKIDIGDHFVDKDGRILKLVGFDSYSGENKRDGEYTNYCGLFDLWDRFDKIWVEPQWSHRIEFKYLDKHTQIDESPDEFIAIALDSLTNPPQVEEEEVDDETTAITTPNSKYRMIQMRDHLKMVQDRTTAMMSVIDRMMNSHKHQVSVLRKKTEELEKVILLAETFMGIYQEVHTFRQGIPASSDEPLYVRQRVAYMDEEVGDVTREGGVIGVDFRRIEDFDEWLLTDDNYKYLVPEEKCIVAIKPSRLNRHYSSDWLANMRMNNSNNMMYLLIRNGENLYRIWTEMAVEKELFPPESVYQEIMEAILNDGSPRTGKFGNQKYWNADYAKKAEFAWRKNAVLIEGFFYHSDVLKPHDPDISLFKEQSYVDNKIILIRDAEALLHDGSMRFREWKAKINSSIKKGSRIVLAGNMTDHVGSGTNFDSDRWGDRYYSYCPPHPEDGIYELVSEADRKIWGYGRDDSDNHMYKFMYLPNYRWSDSERRMSFWIHPDDRFVLNYDMISLSNVNYFIASRIERDSYSDILPMLYKLREELIVEEAYELDFAKLISNEMKCDLGMVEEAISWWKYKNIYNRPLKKDDAKAWRMIRGRIKTLKKELKKNAEAERT